MHTYSKSGDGSFDVGYYLRNRVGDIEQDEWVQLSKHDSERRAIQRVNALNGGDGKPGIWDDERP